MQIKSIISKTLFKIWISKVMLINLGCKMDKCTLIATEK